MISRETLLRGSSVALIAISAPLALTKVAESQPTKSACMVLCCAHVDDACFTPIGDTIAYNSFYWNSPNPCPKT